MSRLTSRAPFNRPSVLDVLPARPVPLSPPETELEPGPPLPHEDSYSPPETQQVQTETPIQRFRKIAYTTSGLSNRDPRPNQRQSRWLVMVIPPPSLTHEPPLLGHTLSSAPEGRFANGILMPLFPTLYGQLTAIAREFNMPSTTGVCIYLQLQESSNSVLTPRVSDESWQLLWGHFFAGDERAAPLPAHGLPISGRIEFDIDLRRAKWFNSWMGHPIRERAESEWMSQETSMVPTHWRGDSRTSLFHADQAGEESPSPPNPSGTAISSRTAVQRHLPRPLLLERRDTSSIRSFSRHQSRAPSVSNDLVPTEPPVQTSTSGAEPTFVPNALSPVVQEHEEPQTAKKAEIDSLVRQWRQSSVTGAASTALAAAGQPSLDPVNMPSGTDVELDLNDFAWSISSAGPPSESPLSPGWPEPLPSVHLLGRMQGSVCLTPSVCTSFGPSDYDWPESPVSCVSRRPSPDLGERMLDFAPLTPTTATSWGPDDPPSPTISEYGDIYDYRAPSIDIGVRGMGSRPATPSTATSWGPTGSPLFLPDSPVKTRTPDVGERAFPDLEIGLQAARAPVYPYYSAWSTEPWGHVWPYQTHRRRGSDIITLIMPVPRSRDRTLLPEWPDSAALYPSDPTIQPAAANKSQPVTLPASTEYPFFELYPTVYPHNLGDIYPARLYQTTAHQRKDSSTSITPMTPGVSDKSFLPEWPDFGSLYPPDPSVERAAANKSQPVWLPRPEGYPFFDLYPTVYPYNLHELYPALSYSRCSSIGANVYSDSTLASIPLGLSVDHHDHLPEWPDFAALYPVNPRAKRAAANKCQQVQLPRSVDYPLLEIYPVVYPYNLQEIYPSIYLKAGTNTFEDQGLGQDDIVRKKALTLQWPDFASLYPRDRGVERAAANKSKPVTLEHRGGYPTIVLYDTIYPYNLQEIYPPAYVYPSVLASKKTLFKPVGELLPEYAESSSLYPSDRRAERVIANKSQPVTLSDAGYPFLAIYPSVYPFNLSEIYSSCHFETATSETTTRECISVKLPVYSGYPTFELYPAPQGFPTFEIYPPISLIVSSPIAPSSTKLSSVYPMLEIYEPVYPYLIIYPQAQLTALSEDVPSRPISPRKRTLTPGPGRRRPTLSNANVAAGQEESLPRRLSRSPVKRSLVPPLPSLPSATSAERCEPRRTHLDLHMSVFGADALLPNEPAQTYAARRRSRRTHHDLHLLVFNSMLSGDGLQDAEDIIPELPSHSLPPAPPTVTRQRNRSGTISSRPLPSAVRPVRETIDSEQPTISLVRGTTTPTRIITGRTRRPSVSTATASVSGIPLNTSDISSYPAASSNTAPRIQALRRGPSLSGLPSSPGDTKAVLNRVRSMNTQMKPDATSSRGSESVARGLDRSKSMSDTNRVEMNRHSMVAERARMFVVSEASDAPNDLPTPSSRPVAKLNRTQLPFA